MTRRTDPFISTLDRNSLTDGIHAQTHREGEEGRDGRGTPASVSAAEWQCGQIDGRGTPAVDEGERPWIFWASEEEEETITVEIRRRLIEDEGVHETCRAGTSPGSCRASEAHPDGQARGSSPPAWHTFTRILAGETARSARIGILAGAAARSALRCGEVEDGFGAQVAESGNEEGEAA